MNELLHELKLDLEEDLLDYGWVLQVARDCGAAEWGLPVTQVTYNAVAKLLDDGMAEIGDARQEGDRLEFYAWPGSVDEQKARLKRTIDEVGTDPGLGEGFWLAKPLPK